MCHKNEMELDVATYEQVKLLPNILSSYENGNVRVVIFENGTKLRWTPDDESVKINHPESIDLKITNSCYHDCPFCYANSSSKGKHADLSKFPRWIETLPEGMEVAIGGGTIFASPYIEELLFHLKKRKCIASITINEKDLQNEDACNNLSRWYSKDHIHGLGISIDPRSISLSKEDWIGFISKTTPTGATRYLKNDIVLHVINGIHSPKNLLKISPEYKLLILGYKWDTGRAERRNKNSFESHEITKLQDDMQASLLELSKHFFRISFDNLAIKQLDIGEAMPTSEWELRYMGDDGQYSCYVDAVENYIAISSIQSEERSLKINPKWDINTMFARIRAVP